MTTKYQRETGTKILEEVKPLLALHWKEIAHYQDILLEPDWNSYAKCEEQGFLRVYTARKDGNLIGYGVYFVRYNLHYKSSLQASQDILFVHPDHRGIGARFIHWCDTQLQAEGVQAVYHHVKQAHNFGPLLERMGYQLVDLIYAKRLDK